MCTSIIEVVGAEGMAKRGDEWFALSHAVVAYDHARHAHLGDVITLDFMNAAVEPGARAGIELTLETAKELRAPLALAIVAAAVAHAEEVGSALRATPPYTFALLLRRLEHRDVVGDRRAAHVEDAAKLRALQ